MYWKSLITCSLISAALLPVTNALPSVGGLVNTTSGLVQGHASSLRPEVSEYLGIRYAKPAKGDLRFAAPVPVDKRPGIFNATKFGPDCPCNRVPMNNSYLGGPVGQKITVALSQQGNVLDEDCLSINVWTKPQTGEKKKAVLFWIYGGGFSIGSANSPVYDGSILAEENDVVVVSFNYRLNIFGFSGAPGQPANVGLLDQRLALEWTRDNIERFGGDPARITVFGQSAGGMSTDLVAYANPEDPIAHGLIAHSGVVSPRIGSNETQILSTWYNVSATLGCGDASAGEETVTCMRNKSQEELLAAIETHGTSALMSGFVPYGDGVVLPHSVAEAAEAGDFAKIPFLTGNTDYEAGFFFIVAIAYSNITTIEEVDAIPWDLVRPLGNLLTRVAFTCPAADAAELRRKHGVPSWRYRYYGGNYANTEIYPVGSDWHTSDMLTVFGTAAAVTGVEDSPYEAKAAAYMRDAWATFAKNPSAGLREKLKWPTYHPLKRTLVQLSLNRQTKASFTYNWRTDALCDAIASLADVAASVSSIFQGVQTGGGGGGISRRSFEDLLKRSDEAARLLELLEGIERSGEFEE
ncbi:Alpha/Beta hydrolase protein [Aspergillus pseudoustus]|uniref:Carboxylic ester hydrolase n=1 Tax=Aspergillus pseudoustus TaxID=1810923 RepID=A0ABR4K1E7_9EURO